MMDTPIQIYIPITILRIGKTNLMLPKKDLYEIKYCIIYTKTNTV